MFLVTKRWTQLIFKHFQHNTPLHRMQMTVVTKKKEKVVVIVTVTVNDTLLTIRENILQLNHH